MAIQRGGLSWDSKEVAIIIDLAPEGIYGVGANGDCIFINKAAINMLGYTKEQCIGKNMHQLIHSRPKNRTAYPQTKHSNHKVADDYTESVAGEDVFRKADGSFINVRYSINPILDVGLTKGAIVTFTDITRQKQLNQDISIKRTNSQALIDGSLDLIWSVDSDCKIITANRAYAEMILAITGNRPKERDSVFLPEFGGDLNKKWKSYYRKALKGERYHVTEHFYNPVNQQTEYALITFNPIVDDRGKQTGVACYSKDITEETLALRNLEKAKAALNKIIDASPDIICTIDENGQFVQVGGAVFAILGYIPDELTGKLYINSVHPDDKVITLEAAANIMSGLTVTHFENRYIRKDGSLVSMVWSARWDAQDKTIHCIARDATEKKLAEKQLELSDMRFKSLVQDGSDLIGILDMDANYTYVSPTSLPILGYDPEELIGKCATEFIHPDDADTALSQFDRLAIEKQIKIPPFRFRHKNGTWRWIETVVTDLMDNPAVKGIVANSRDITERRKAEDELRNFAEKLSTATKIARLGYWQLDPDGSNRFWSDEVYDIWGVSKESFTLSYESFSKTIHPDDLQKFALEQEQAVAGNKEIDLEYRILLPDGTNKWIYEKGSQVKSESGVPSIIRGTVQDVTRQKLLALSLQKTNQRYKYATKATFDALWDWDVLKSTLFWGEGFKNIFGYDTKGLQPISSWTDHIHPDDIENVTSGIYDIINGSETNWTDEYRYQKADGSYAYVIDRGFVIRNDIGKAVRMVGAMQDISKSKMHEVALEESNQRFAYAAKATSEAIWEWNAHQPQIFKEYGYQDLFGYHFTDHQGDVSFWASKVHPNDYEHTWLAMEKTKADPLTNDWTIEYRFLKANNEYICIKEKAILLRDDNGNLVRMIGSMQDVTLQKLEEEQLKLFADDLYKRNKELQQFGYVVSHNLRAPVANILGITTLLEMDRNDPEMVEKYTNDLKITVNSLDNVIKDLSTILSITDGSVELMKDNVDITEIFHNVTGDLKDIIAYAGAKINFPLKSSWILSHKAYLYSIFYNLISNAIKYRSEAIPEVDIKVQNDNEFVKIIVTDNGIGIDIEKHIENLFKPYKRFNAKVEGKGLGLFLVKSHVEALMGQINIESKVGAGTSFTITLPVV
jgi:PAS domain S-box-containing protein